MVVGVAVTTGVRVWMFDTPPPAMRTTPAPWGLPDEPARRIRAAGLPRYAEDGAEHFHTHLDVFVDGAAVALPGGVGLTPPYSAVHTHSDSGIVHVEAVERPVAVTLGQLFTVWGVRLSPTCVGGHCSAEPGVRLFVNGAERPGDPQNLRLVGGEQVTVVVGRAPSVVPGSYDCYNAADIERESCRRSFPASRA